MEWFDLPESEIFELLRRGKLRHPTNSKFDPKPWASAISELQGPTLRDMQLGFAAIYYGKQITALRDTAKIRLPKISKTKALRLLAATANQQFLTGRNKLREHVNSVRDKKAPINLVQAGQKLFDTQYGQKFNLDDLTTSLVDALPCWLFQICNGDDETTANSNYNPTDIAGIALSIASIENGLRTLWQETVWTNATLLKYEDRFVSGWDDKDFAARWLAWSLRQETLICHETYMDAGARTIAGRKILPRRAALSKTVTRMYWGHTGRRRFVCGSSKRIGTRTNGYAQERDALERLYTGLYLDEPLSKTVSHLTCRELLAAWWVLSDIGALVAKDLGDPWFETDKDVSRFAISLEKTDLARVFSSCLSISVDRAGEIVNFFLCNPNDTKQLFSNGLWSTPLLDDPNSDSSHLILAPLLVGSPVKRVEAWFTRGGIADHKGVKSKGRPFENHVRSAIKKALTENDTLTDKFVFPAALKRSESGEEIDFLAQIGRTIIVGEVKCLIAPSDAIDKKNLLDTLNEATDQAARKRDWVAANIGMISTKLGVNDPGFEKNIRVQAVVILNHGFGLGLKRYNVPIVDLHYFQLLIGSPTYQGDTRFEKGVGALSEPKSLYRDQEDFEHRLGDLLENPKPFQPYLDAIGWRTEPFPTANGAPLNIEMPTMVLAPADFETVARLEELVTSIRDKT